MKIEYHLLVGKSTECQPCPNCCFLKTTSCLPYHLYPCMLLNGFEKSQGDVFKL